MNKRIFLEGAGEIDEYPFIEAQEYFSVDLKKKRVKFLTNIYKMSLDELFKRIQFADEIWMMTMCVGSSKVYIEELVRMLHHHQVSEKCFYNLTGYLEQNFNLNYVGFNVDLKTMNSWRWVCKNNQVWDVVDCRATQLLG